MNEVVITLMIMLGISVVFGVGMIIFEEKYKEVEEARKRYMETYW